MNFGYRETIDKQKDLVSVQRKVVSKSLSWSIKSISLSFSSPYYYSRISGL